MKMSHCCAIDSSDNGECARREAVAILVEQHEMSERRACAAIVVDAPRIMICASACGRWHPSGVDSATGGCLFC